MRPTVFIAAIVVAIMSWTIAPIHAGLPIFRERPFSEVEDVLCEQDSMTVDNTKIEIRLADRKREKFNCLDACYKVRYRCERTDKNRPGTRANDRASAKCQERYRGCLDRCESPTVQ